MSDAARNGRWDISYVVPGLAATGLLAVVGGPLAWWLRGGYGLLWTLVGLGIVAAFFSASALAVAGAGRVLGDAVTLPAALGTYLLKIVVLGMVMVSVRDLETLDSAALAVAVVAGTVTWAGIHLRRVWTSKIFYVDYVEPDSR